MRRLSTRTLTAALALALSSGACLSKAPEGIAAAKPAQTTVKLDFFHKPLPDIPLPNDLATRHDATSATGRRVNASMVAPTAMERRVRTLIDGLDGWGTFQPIVIPFSGPLDVQSVLAAHRDPRYGMADDVVYVVNVTRGSPRFGKAYPLDLGNGNYPVQLEKLDLYWKNDPRGNTLSLGFEETKEDVNGNGKLDPGEDVNGNGALDAGEDTDGDGVLDPPEDTDADGLLDEPNRLPGTNPAADDLAARSDALMTFYEKQTNTLIVRLMEPLDERTTYAVVVTRRLKDAQGEPVGSPYPWVNHASQTEALEPLAEVLPAGLAMDDVAFAFTYTTQSAQSAMVAVRDGLYGLGVQAHLGTEYPARLAELLPLRDAAHSVKKPHLLHAEQWLPTFESVLTGISGMKPTSERYKAIIEGMRSIDYFVVGSFESPQLFEREGPDGKWLPLDAQSWPADLDTKKVRARRETVYFTLSVPRREISARGEGKQVPVVLQGHGYSSNRFEGMQLAGFFAKHGFATLSIEAPSHGLSVGDLDRGLIKGIFANAGLSPAADALLLDRSFNQDHDPLHTNDSGADFWTAYLFHTRDIVRQYVLDWMQAVRIVRGFDGAQKWTFDTNGDGTPDLAGDFDGDGVVDLGKESELHMVGGSLGGMISMLMGSLEPEMTAVTPISGGGGFGDMGIRTTQSGAYEGFILRAMAPLYAGTLDESGSMLLETIIPNLNTTGTVAFARVTGVKRGDTMVVENLANGSRGCGYVTADGKVRAAVESDKGDATRLVFYAGPQLTGDTACSVRDGVEPSVVVDSFGLNAAFQWDEEQQSVAWAPGDPLVALADGLGLRRAHPDLRRFQGLGQLVLDAADPVTFARHMLKEPLVYGNGQKTGTHTIVVTTLGDLAVPASSGITFGRAAGLIDYQNDDPRFGKPMNQVLLDNYVAEAVHTYKRYTDPSGEGVHIDVENFANGEDLWGSDIPRLATPLRNGIGKADALGGMSAALFPFPQPDGAHGFDMPGQMRDRARSKAGCAAECLPAEAETNVCACVSRPFDMGHYMFNMLAGFLASGGTEISTEVCLSRDDCPGRKPAPEARAGAVIDERDG